MRRLVNGVIWMVGLGVLLWVYFLVPLGRYTLFQHTMRIAATEPAQELSEELEHAGGRLVGEAGREWEERRRAEEEAGAEDEPRP